METERRLLLALALTAVFLMAWAKWFAPQPTVNPEGVSDKLVTADSMPAADEPLSGRTLQPSSSDGASSAEGGIAQRPIEVESSGNGLANFTWTSLAGSPQSIVLKRYFETVGRDVGYRVVPVGSVLDVPVYWQFNYGGQTWDDANIVYEQVAFDPAERVVYRHVWPNGVEVEKTYRWSEDSYVVDNDIVVTNRGLHNQGLTASIVLTAKPHDKPESRGFFSMFKPDDQATQALVYLNEAVKRWPLDKIQSSLDIPQGRVEWAGFDQQYFVWALLPVEGQWERVTPVIPTQAVANEKGLMLSYPRWDIAAGNSQRFSVQYYAGPKDIDVLERVSPALGRAIDLGSWLGVIARPLLHFLRWLYGLIPNYGVAIILLTVAVRLLMFPLTQMQAKSMRRMQEHKPQMDALKEKFADDREAYSRELMSYMRSHKINPAGGCLLLLPQLPIFFALYRVLYNSIELRHEPFMLWIHDLSAHDPYFVMPVLLGITMWFQQKLTPMASADPTQVAIMKFMPLMFTAFMVFLPSGLNLYIFVSTLWGVAQQYWIQRGVVPIGTSPQKVSGRTG